MASLLPIKGGSGMKPSGSLSELPLDEKKAEKHLKKARPFFDDKLKAKQRLSSLWTYIEATGDTEQQRFFAENQTAIATTVCDAFYYQIDKIRAKEKDRGLLATGKEAAELLRILGVVQYIFRHLGPALPQASYADGLVGLLEVLLADTNHPRLRLEGFRLLLLLYARIGTAWTPIDARGVTQSTVELYSARREQC
ncbi:hypothetical protein CAUPRSCDRAFT_11702 [Caulochytrium protostelioides]|uniref:Uncharacterized protein n=1 Tax=Caulochytrium protostelioides TaxID=1555241 RepID=A0A4P9WTM3_9FUNG|nr:hypothetical protein CAUPRSCDRAFT_11702 [Caulochytrium protostelioides]